MAMTVKSGRWSDPTVWDTGAVPGAGAMAHIMAPHEIIYDRESDAILHDVMSEMGSKLTWDSAKETRMRVNTIMLSGIAEMVDKGLSATPGKPKHEIVFHPIEGKDPGASTRLGVMFMGPTRIHGYKKKGHLRAHELSLPAGAQTIRLAGVGGSGWRVGDILVILGTNYLLPATADPQYSGPTQFWYRFADTPIGNRSLNEYQFGEDEQRTITAIDGDTITLDAPLTYTHDSLVGTLKDGQQFRKTPVVVNNSRSIRWRTATAAEDGHLDPYADHTILQRRAHSMFMRIDDGDARYFETKNMARTSTDPSLFVADLPYQVDRAGGVVTVDKLRASNGGPLLENPENVRGRYAIHIHWCGGPYKGSPQFNLIGAVAWAPVGDHPIPGWAITHHGSRAAIEDCVVSNVRGAGMVSELGNEIGQWADNVVTGVRGDGDRTAWSSRSEHFSNHNGSVGVAYECQSRAVLMHGNIAGSAKYAFLWHAQKDNKVKRGLRDVDPRFMDGLTKGSIASGQYYEDEVVGHVNPQIPPMIDNEAIACRFGFSVIHRISGHTVLGIGDKTPMLMDRFFCLNVPFAWEVPEYSNTYYVKDSVFQGPLNMMGSSMAIRLGSVSWDWNFSNCLLRNYKDAHPHAGAGMNYEGYFIDMLYENVTNTTAEFWSSAAGLSTHAARDVMGPWEQDPDNTDRWMIRRYESIDSETLPQPYPLAPYGRKLPATDGNGVPYPPVNPGDTPYFVLGDGTNGAASTVPVAINLTLNAASGRNSGALYGIIRDSVGDRRYPDWQTSETFPTGVGVKSHRTIGKQTPVQLVQRWGCWNDNGTWKCRTWFFGADRFTHAKFTFHVDWILTNFEAEFLARHDLGAAPSAPDWCDQLEVVPAEQRPLTPVVKPLRFLSRTRLQAVDGQVLSHRLRPSAVLTNLAIVGGTDAALFKIEFQKLVWAGSQPAVRTAPYEVMVRATDCWGNSVEALHQVEVISAARVSSIIADNFNRPDEDLDANPAYIRLKGSAGAMAVRSNQLATIGSEVGAIYDLGSLGTSEQEITVNWSSAGGGLILMRMVDENNWVGFGRNDGVAGTEVFMCIGGTSTRLAVFDTASPARVKCLGNRIVVAFHGTSTNEPRIFFPKTTPVPLLKLFDLDPLEEPGALLLPAEAPMGTKVGLRKSSNIGFNPWLDNFSARALEG